eukprot:CAMPEP_0177268056 /NCGR_PEP_ID=MMETSP0367-20130122/63599_1 /TAXON_ID=447022 ORGANISM="Scrippsiella hangoei-like, Strain SHHI-4" /NCGR_SAMPLE_ID=MMETSP0367 /ASSEMBLY_ACC=CAM_ASM_000362 /LENGTH=73 /DNA_ID=CAMNT_0018723637 /DNA_START=37 /DNA_END=254 /DNA_ORIENTATION=-
MAAFSELVRLIWRLSLPGNVPESAEIVRLICRFSSSPSWIDPSCAATSERASFKASCCCLLPHFMKLKQGFMA